MIIVAYLQNQYFNEPDRIKAIYAAHPDKRLELNKRYLFFSCRTGQVLREALGEDLCDQILWDNASPEIGSYSASKFKADPVHIRGVIEEVKPDLVLAFGKISCEAIKNLELSIPILYGPHPAARFDPMPALREMKIALLRQMKRIEHRIVLPKSEEICEW